MFKQQYVTLLCTEKVWKNKIPTVLTLYCCSRPFITADKTDETKCRMQQAPCSQKTKEKLTHS